MRAIAGENAGSKLAKAEKLDVQVWDEKTLMEQLSGDSIEEKPTSSTAQPTLFDY